MMSRTVPCLLLLLLLVSSLVHALPKRKKSVVRGQRQLQTIQRTPGKGKSGSSSSSRPVAEEEEYTDTDTDNWAGETVSDPTVARPDADPAAAEPDAEPVADDPASAPVTVDDTAGFEEDPDLFDPACKAAKNGDIYKTDQSVEVGYTFEVDSAENGVREAVKVQDEIQAYLTQALILDQCDRRRSLAAVDSVRGIEPGNIVLEQPCRDASDSCYSVQASNIIYLDNDASSAGVVEEILVEIDQGDIELDESLGIVFFDEESFDIDSDNGDINDAQSDNGGISAVQAEHLEQEGRSMKAVGIFFLTALMLVLAGALVFFAYKKSRSGKHLQKKVSSEQKPRCSFCSFQFVKRSYSNMKKTCSKVKQSCFKLNPFGELMDDDDGESRCRNLPGFIVTNDTMDTQSTNVEAMGGREMTIDFFVGTEMILADLEQEEQPTTSWSTTIIADEAELAKFSASLDLEEDLKHEPAETRRYSCGDTVEL
jgi:hypothetical protein